MCSPPYLILIFLAVLTTFCHQPNHVFSQETGQVPAAAVNALRDMDKQIVAAEKKALKVLNKQMKESTKKGELTVATAIQKKIEQITQDMQYRISGVAYVSVDPIVGRWQVGKTFFEFSPNGTFKTQHDNMAGTWERRQNKVQITSTAGNNQIFEVEAKESAFWSWNSGRSTGNAKRLSDSAVSPATK